MKKITPQSLLFTLAPDIPPETLLIQASETLSSLNAMTTDLAFELRRCQPLQASGQPTIDRAR